MTRLAPLPRLARFLLLAVLTLAPAAEAVRVHTRPPPPPPPPPKPWTIQSLGSLGGGSTFAFGINTRGEVVGSSATNIFGGFDPYVHGYVWDRGRMRDAGTPSGPNANSTLIAINDSGTAVGKHNDLVYLYRNGKWSSLHGVEGDPAGINRFGDVAGSYYNEQATGYRGYLYRRGTLVDLGSL